MIYTKNNHYELHLGKMQDVLPILLNDSVDAVITDPPYELGFMGKSWDNSGVAFQKETWQHCYRVLKPGGYLLAFGGTRTFHRIACAIEDAGFEIRDTIMWLYGCLSEDTEILTKNGFKNFHKITNEDIIRIYDIENGIYKWEKPERWNVYSVNKDTLYRIKSDSTEQLVSRNHRCLVERDGKLVFEFAENLGRMERVPVLPYDIPYIQESNRNILFTDLLWQDESLVEKIFSKWDGEEESKKISLQRNKPVLERWGDLSQAKRKLYESKYQICEMSERIYNDGEKRWICNGASIDSSTSNSSTFIEYGSCPSYQSQCGRQQIGKSNVVCNESRPQELREWKTYQTTLATITEEEYTGIIYCPTVSTGCFVARRNGKVFITGNSGFPKSMNIGLAIDKKNGVDNRTGNLVKDVASNNTYSMKNGLGGRQEFSSEYEERQATNEWAGWGTCLKPAYEPIIVARKPFKGSLVDNVLENGVGGLNIDECRIECDEKLTRALSVNEPTIKINNSKNGQGSVSDTADRLGRFPANVILTYDEADKDEVCGGMPNTTSKQSFDATNRYLSGAKNNGNFMYGSCNEYNTYDDEGSAARYFYCAKASKRDRDEGLDLFENKVKVFNGKSDQSSKDVKDVEQRFTTVAKNIHPTVKPVALMQYLIRLVAPKGSVILDPFNGSGSTGKACMYENNDRDANYYYIGVEMTEEYLPISKARIDFALNNSEHFVVDDTEPLVLDGTPATTKKAKTLLW